MTRKWRNCDQDNVLKKFQCGAILFNSKTGKLPNERICSCGEAVEDLHHVVLKCKLYKDLRDRSNINNETQIEDILQLQPYSNTNVDVYYLQMIYKKRFLT